jgi:membrane-bound lytic murein transglycosylase D
MKSSTETKQHVNQNKYYKVKRGDNLSASNMMSLLPKLKKRTRSNSLAYGKSLKIITTESVQTVKKNLERKLLQQM